MNELKIEVVKYKDISPILREELCEEARICFPQFTHRYGHRFYFEALPEVVFIARYNDKIVGFRNLVERRFEVGGREVFVAGLSVAVDPEYRGRGIAKSLTSSILDYINEGDYDAAMAFVISPVAVHMLETFDFKEIKTPLYFRDSQTDELLLSDDRIFIKDIRGANLIKEIERLDKIYVGAGVW